MTQKEDLIQSMVNEGWTYKGENKWYVMFDWIKNGKSIQAKDWIKSEKRFVTYNPNQKISIKCSEKLIKDIDL